MTASQLHLQVMSGKGLMDHRSLETTAVDITIAGGQLDRIEIFWNRPHIEYASLVLIEWSGRLIGDPRDH